MRNLAVMIGSPVGVPPRPGSSDGMDMWAPGSVGTRGSGVPFADYSSLPNQLCPSAASEHPPTWVIAFASFFPLMGIHRVRRQGGDFHPYRMRPCDRPVDRLSPSTLQPPEGYRNAQLRGRGGVPPA